MLLSIDSPVPAAMEDDEDPMIDKMRRQASAIVRIKLLMTNFLRVIAHAVRCFTGRRSPRSPGEKTGVVDFAAVDVSRFQTLGGAIAEDKRLPGNYAQPRSASRLA
jgi:hypothetical protein